MTNTSSRPPSMLKSIVTLTGLVLVVLGGGLAFASHWMAKLYGTTESVSGTNASRTARAAILALGILAWLGKKQDVKVLRTTVVPVLFVWFLVKGVVAYWAVANGAFEAGPGIAVLVFDAILAAAYAYYFFVMVVAKPEKSR